MNKIAGNAQCVHEATKTNTTSTFICVMSAMSSHSSNVAAVVGLSSDIGIYKGTRILFMATTTGKSRLLLIFFF